jgi:hypothetical protein
MNNINHQNYQHVVGEFKQMVDPKTFTGDIVEKKGMPALLRYLKHDQYFQIATIPSRLKTAQHALIRLEGKRICEWCTRPTGWKAPLTQLEIRKAPGKTIEKIWQTHLQLAPKYHKLSLLSDSPEGYINYVPFKNDCFSYVNRVLTENKQSPTTLHRIKKCS